MDYSSKSILVALEKIKNHHLIIKTNADFGQGNSAQLFLDSIENTAIWKVNHQKQFRDS